MVILSTGEAVGNPGYYARDEKRLAKAQRRHAKKKKGSASNIGCFGALSPLVNQASAAPERHPVALPSIASLSCRKLVAQSAPTQAAEAVALKIFYSVFYCRKCSE